MTQEIGTRNVEIWITFFCFIWYRCLPLNRTLEGYWWAYFLLYTLDRPSSSRLIITLTRLSCKQYYAKPKLIFKNFFFFVILLFFTFFLFPTSFVCHCRIHPFEEKTKDEKRKKKWRHCRTISLFFFVSQLEGLYVRLREICILIDWHGCMSLWIYVCVLPRQFGNE